MRESGAATRAHRRVLLPAPVSGALGGRHAVRILDLSLHGARVAHGEILAIHAPCALQFTLEDQPLTLTAHLVWSSVVRRTSPPGGGPLFNSGLAFESVPAPARTLLVQALGPVLEEPLLAAGVVARRAEATADEAGTRFSPEALRAAWAWAGRCCECKQEGHGHTNSCQSELVWSLRGTNRAGGWEARLRQAALPGSTEAENCEIVCRLCYELDLPVAVAE